MRQIRKQLGRGQASPEAHASNTAATRNAKSRSSLADSVLVKTLEIATLTAHDQDRASRTGSLPEHLPSSAGSSSEHPQEVHAAAAGALRTEELELSERLRSLAEQVRLRDAALDATTTHFVISRWGPEDAEIVYVNRAASEDYGYSPEELLGKSPGLLVPPELNPGARAEIWDALEKGTSIRVQLRARRKDGTTFIAGMTVTPIRDRNENRHHAVAVGANITTALAEREATNRLQERERMGMELRFAQKLESIGRLAARIAHEISTPIQFVGDGLYFLKSAVAELQQLVEVYRGALQALVRGDDPGAVQSRLERAEANLHKEFLDTEIPAAFEYTQEGVERVASIVRAMNEFAHPDAKEHSPADLNHAIETTLLVARNEYRYRAHVETDLPELPPVVCNIGELNQVFLNLIVNAAHAIEAAGRDVTSGLIRIRTALAGQWVRIEFEDNGCGIPKENLERIFDPFFTTKEVGKGTGQGLAIARSIVVEKHGGRIEVESEVGRGTRMILNLRIHGRAAGGS